MEICFHLQDILPAAEKFWQQWPLQKVFAFHGNMGAGKTTFIHALCTAKGVTDTVGSPTFSIINEYAYPGGKVYHIDLYRLRDEEEALRAGVEDVLYSGELCLVEWPDRAPGIFPPATIALQIAVIDPETRKITQISDS
ncbi:tRNA (adenosine(37)-N6)-threonylcarbamoyltransferase complex ATPase subunit type 1 TsaE [Flavitalea sp. BT771]|uniref:tRNA (adenosine(37)-N6)-threonylcarbamoyltransferase complex ATPase subunit type 1 TsaE n=1 Tax=Flavitalea sp. BT771 TaxID=3063329 RepID=UPI0026E2A9D5|nr:tRNA (adenosine(37)-N6)-threonylcarbamoyltransferase complex ATPase subunit type 1 TsaE [Flavitalea sp. BT771]MDO6433945.1 tRNA (adenosine(37)-N6)-threonylcarbamoyltransferase complex ATPase subunit type 1 TsaE [Flavitalea sp. BT771]MDV6222846.1 tRNA (adenosine(37)-N6)-threonylcarbamoyltransferase complex ATPase subunit type 1 TsaE [Flavitalea sp. BT771]